MAQCYGNCSLWRICCHGAAWCHGGRVELHDSMVTKPYLVLQRLYHVLHLFSPRIGHPTTGALFTGELRRRMGAFLRRCRVLGVGSGGRHACTIDPWMCGWDRLTHTISTKQIWFVRSKSCARESTWAT
jgi:hypothetical protein